MIRIGAGPWLDWDGVISLLKLECRAIGGQSTWAKRHKVSCAYVNDVLQGRRMPGKKITKAMGLEAALMWRKPAQIIQRQKPLTSLRDNQAMTNPEQQTGEK